MAGIQLGSSSGAKESSGGSAQMPAVLGSAGAGVGATSGLAALARGGRKTRSVNWEAADKDGSLTILMQGDKDASKTCAVPGVPVPEGTARYVVTYDETSKQSLLNYYGARRLAELDVQCIEMAAPDPGTDWPGMDPNQPWTGEAVVGETMALLEELEESREAGLIYLDHFQALYEVGIPAYVRHVNGLDPTEGFEFQHWALRTQTASLIEAKVRRCAAPGGIAMISGYAPEERKTMKKVFDAASNRTINKVVDEVKSPSWLKDNIKRNWLVTLHARALRSGSEELGNENGDAQTDYVIDVMTSKVARFKKGARVNITGKDLSVFWQDDVYETLAQTIEVEPVA